MIPRFPFYRITQKSGHRTDNLAGTRTHFIGYVLSGEILFDEGTSVLRVKAGDLFYLPKNMKYTSTWLGEGGTTILSFGFSYFPREVVPFPPQILDVPPDILSECLSIPTVGEADPAAAGAFYTLLASLLPYMKGETVSPSRALVRAAGNVMQNDLSLTVPQVARALAVGERTLYAAFRKENTTPVSLQRHLKIEAAKEMLSATSLPVEEISERLGFSSSSYFRKVFALENSLSPAGYRKQNKLL